MASGTTASAAASAWVAAFASSAMATASASLVAGTSLAVEQHSATLWLLGLTASSR